MDVPLQDCTIEEERGVVRFIWAEGVKTLEIHRRMLAQYGQNTMRQRKVYEWVERFNPLNAELNPICHLLVLLGAHHILHVSRKRVKSGRTHVTDEGRSGRPSTSRSRKASSPQEYRK